MDLPDMRCRIETISQFGLAALTVLLLAGCASSEGTDFTLSNTKSSSAIQPYPANYRSDLPAFMRTYLNDPRGIREASIAEPVQRSIRGRQLFVVCLRYNARSPDGSYPGASDRAVIFVDARLDRLVETGKELCSGAIYQPYPDLEKLQR